MLVELPPPFFDRLIHHTAGSRRSHDLRDRNLRSPAVIGRHAATHIALGDDAGQLESIGILNHGRATAA
jgi:hypothetical protein